MCAPSYTNIGWVLESDSCFFCPPPGSRGGRRDRRAEAAVRHLGQHGQRGQQDGVHGRNGQDTGQGKTNGRERDYGQHGIEVELEINQLIRNLG